MVEIQGNASTGYVYNDTGPLDLPRDTSTIRAAHQPWCVDCKRKGRELDVDQRCPQCARAVITRAEGAARRAAAEQAAAEAKAAAQKQTSSTPKPPMEGKQGKPTTRSSAPRATQTSDVPDRGRTPGRAPGAGSSTHREKNPPTVQETRPETVGGPSQPVENRQPDTTSTPAPPTAEQILDAQVAHAAELLRSTANHPHPAVQAERAAVIAALEALHLLVELTNTQPATAPRPSGRTGTRRIALPVEQVIAAYHAGQNLSDIAKDLGVSHMTVRRCLVDHDVPRRNSPVEHTPELIEQVRRLYEDEHLTQAEIAIQIGRSQKAVHRIMNTAGIDRRAAKARTARDNAHGLKQHLVDLGVTSADIKRWAVATGLLDHTPRGLPSRALIEQYAAAHPTPSAAQTA